MRISHNTSYYFFLFWQTVYNFTLYSLRLNTKPGLNQKFLTVLLRLRLHRNLKSLTSWERIRLQKLKGIVVCRCDWRTVIPLCWPMCMNLKVTALFIDEGTLNIISWAEFCLNICLSFRFTDFSSFLFFYIFFLKKSFWLIL